MTDHPTRLADFMARARLTDPELGRRADTSKQQIFKLRKGERKMSREWAERLAPHLGVTWPELMEGDWRLAPAPQSGLPPALHPSISIPEYDLAEADGKSPVEKLTVLAHWTLPHEMVRAHAGEGAELGFVRVSDDAMTPDYLPTDRVLIDFAHKVASPAGVYLLWDGAGIALRQLEPLVGSTPATVRVSATSKRYSPYERPTDALGIIGKVVGKWSWT
ncbi:XRE family transcriptional regulator [Gluconobacter oxydans]|uniref:XRE family transcriptional regulator n=2 Tax=Gluconobacter oxydans TaxID=442 RepID=UPI0039ED526D